MKVKRIYIAGPYTGGDVARNVANAMDAAHALLDMGLKPYVPHLSHYLHVHQAREYEEWMALDLAWLDVCDALLRLPGVSPGADREVARMEELGRPVLRSPDAVRAWAAGRSLEVTG